MSAADLNIFLQLGDKVVPVQIEEVTTERSEHTGAELLVVRGRVSTTGAYLHEWFSRAVEKHGAEGATSQPHPVHGARRWTIARGRYSILNGYRYSYEVRLREVEEL